MVPWITKIEVVSSLQFSLFFSFFLLFFLFKFLITCKRWKFCIFKVNRAPSNSHLFVLCFQSFYSSKVLRGRTLMLPLFILFHHLLRDFPLNAFLILCFPLNKILHRLICFNFTGSWLILWEVCLKVTIYFLILFRKIFGLSIIIFIIFQLSSLFSLIIEPDFFIYL